MGPNSNNQIDSNGKTSVFRVRRMSQPTPFVVRWRALQHELAFNTARLDRFLTEFSQSVATPRRATDETDAPEHFEKSVLSN